MIRRVSAEFETLDAAEWAARIVKAQIDGVAKIQITGKTQQELSKIRAPFNRLGIGGIGATGVFYPYNAGFVGGDNQMYEAENFTSNTNEMEFGREALLDIMCSEESVNKISQVLTSNGGLKVKKHH